MSYQEMMAHVPLYAHPNPKRVLGKSSASPNLASTEFLYTVDHEPFISVIGAGDGGVVREILKHQSVETVVHCEIDQVVMGSLVKNSIFVSKYLIYCTTVVTRPKMSVKNSFRQCLQVETIPD